MNQLFLAAKMMKEAEDEKSGIKSKPEPLPESPAQTMGRGGGLLMRTLIHDVKEAGETGHVHEETGKMLAAMLFAPHGKTLRMLLQTAAPAERRRLAATLLQSSYRGYVRRKAKAKQNYKINLKYELEILAARKKRRGLLVGFFQHLIYLTVLTAVVMLGGGPTPRFELATTLADYIDSTGFGDIATLADYQSWLKNDLFEGLVPSGEEGESRVYLKTYNEILGSIRIEVRSRNRMELVLQRLRRTRAPQPLLIPVGSLNCQLCMCCPHPLYLHPLAFAAGPRRRVKMRVEGPRVGQEIPPERVRDSL